MKQLTYLVKRDLKRTWSLRFFLITVLMSSLCLFFFSSAGGVSTLRKDHTINYMSIMLPQIIFGAWAILAIFYDMMSKDRENGVMDCILCSGVKKNMIILSKCVTILIGSLLFSMIYIIPVFIRILMMELKIGFIALLLKYLLTVWVYILVYAMIGLLVSTIFRSSKSALIISMSLGLFLMPRIVDLVAEKTGINAIRLLSPGIAISSFTEKESNISIQAVAIEFTIFIVVSIILSLFVFQKQDEICYGK